MIKLIMTRLREPSTWAGLAVLSGLLGYNIGHEQAAAIGGGIMALIAVLAPENREDKKS